MVILILDFPKSVIYATDLRHDKTARYHHGKHVVITSYLKSEKMLINLVNNSHLFF